MKPIYNLATLLNETSADSHMGRITNPLLLWNFVNTSMPCLRQGKRMQISPHFLIF